MGVKGENKKCRQGFSVEIRRDDTEDSLKKENYPE